MTPIYIVNVTSVAQCTTTYEIEAENEEEAENNYSEGEIVSQDFENNGFTDNVDSVSVKEG